MSGATSGGVISRRTMDHLPILEQSKTIRNSVGSTGMTWWNSVVSFAGWYSLPKGPFFT